MGAPPSQREIAAALFARGRDQRGFFRRYGDGLADIIHLMACHTRHQQAREQTLPLAGQAPTVSSKDWNKRATNSS